MDQKWLRRVAAGKLGLALLVIGAMLFAEVVGAVAVLFLGAGDESLWAQILPIMGSVVVLVPAMMLIGARDWATPDAREVGATLRYGWWFIAVALGFMVFDLISYFSEGTVVHADWPVRMAETVLLCLLIGLSEEFLFRGVVLNALLGLMGGSNRGVLRAVLVCSLLFGCAHIDFASDLASPLSVAQAALKIVQTGLFSVVLCAAVLRSRNLWGASVLHALDDFLLIAPGVALFHEPLTTEYVFEGEEAYLTIATYLVVIALYLPLAIRAWRDLMRMPATRGAFMERAVAEAQARAAADAAAQARPPAEAQAQLAMPVAAGETAIPAQPAMPQPVAAPPAARPRDSRPPAPKGFEQQNV